MAGQNDRSFSGARAPLPGPLAGIRVIELADEQAEYCGLTLAGLGAEVIKIEPPEGNSTRRIGPFYEDKEGPERSLFFWYYNRGKKSITLDLGQDKGRERFRSLVALCRRHGLWLFSDEAYRPLGPVGTRHLPAAADVYERGISLGVMSKAYGLPGLRIGWIACADGSLLERVERYKHYLSICNSAPSTWIRFRARPALPARFNSTERRR